MPFATAAGRSVAYEWTGDSASGKPTLVFLHEGLGSIRQWRDFPAKVAAATGCRALIYDRYGYGQSEVLAEAKRTVRFMHDEALHALPELLKSLKLENPVLIGHSDGASYSLSLGIGTGDTFGHVLAFSPGVMQPAEVHGKPKIFISHGISDPVMPIDITSRKFVARLKGLGYDVTFREYEGRHGVPPAVAREGFEWFLR